MNLAEWISSTWELGFNSTLEIFGSFDGFKITDLILLSIPEGVMKENNLFKEAIIRLYLSFEFPYLPPLDSFTATACFHLLI